MLEGALQVVGLVFALGIVILLAWFVLRWMGKMMPGAGGATGRLIQVLDRMSFGKIGTLLVVRIEDKVLFISMNEHKTEKLCEFDDPEQKITPKTLDANPDFSTAFKDAVKKMGIGKKSQAQPKDKGESE